MIKLLSISSDAKTIKGEKQNVLTGIMYLAPGKESGKMNVCPFASAGCLSACLYTAGHGAFSNVKNARIERTLAFKNNKVEFLNQLATEIKQLEKKAAKNKLTPVVRLNGTSDIPWENLGIIEQFPHIQFYDYTKNPKRALAWATGKMPKNYHLTFSRSESNSEDTEKVAKAGGNIAVVFSGTLPKTYLGLPVIDGDKDDLRFRDPKGCVVGLKAKGKARKDKSGFVVTVY